MNYTVCQKVIYATEKIEPSKMTWYYSSECIINKDTLRRWHLSRDLKLTVRLVEEDHTNQRAPGLRPQNRRHAVCSRKSRKAGGLSLEESQGGEQDMVRSWG